MDGCGHWARWAPTLLPASVSAPRLSRQCFSVQTENGLQQIGWPCIEKPKEKSLGLSCQMSWRGHQSFWEGSCPWALTTSLTGCLTLAKKVHVTMLSQCSQFFKRLILKVLFHASKALIKCWQKWDATTCVNLWNAHLNYLKGLGQNFLALSVFAKLFQEILSFLSVAAPCLFFLWWYNCLALCEGGW